VAVDLELVRAREEKNRERRYGISLVWFPTPELLRAARTFIAAAQRACPGFLAPYPVAHASVFRCNSLRAPLGQIKETALLAAGAKELRCADVTARKMLLCGDGVLRLQLSPLCIGQSASLQRFFQANALTFEQVTEPWLSFGLVNREHYPDAQAMALVEAAVENIEFPQMQCKVGCLHAAAYEDILLRSHRVLATLILGGATQ